MASTSTLRTLSGASCPIDTNASSTAFVNLTFVRISPIGFDSPRLILHRTLLGGAQSHGDLNDLSAAEDRDYGLLAGAVPLNQREEGIGGSGFFAIDGDDGVGL